MLILGGVLVSPDRPCRGQCEKDGALSYLAVKIFSKYPNLCDHGFTVPERHGWTEGWTDGRTDDILSGWHYRALRRIAR